VILERIAARIIWEAREEQKKGAALTAINATTTDPP
jgi:hypothetical protein